MIRLKPLIYINLFLATLFSARAEALDPFTHGGPYTTDCHWAYDSWWGSKMHPRMTMNFPPYVDRIEFESDGGLTKDEQMSFTSFNSKETIAIWRMADEYEAQYQNVKKHWEKIFDMLDNDTDRYARSNGMMWKPSTLGFSSFSDDCADSVYTVYSKGYFWSYTKAMFTTCSGGGIGNKVYYFTFEDHREYMVKRMHEVMDRQNELRRKYHEELKRNVAVIGLPRPAFTRDIDRVRVVRFGIPLNYPLARLATLDTEPLMKYAEICEAIEVQSDGAIFMRLKNNQQQVLVPRLPEVSLPNIQRTTSELNAKALEMAKSIGN